MNRDKQTEIQQFVIDLQSASQKASKIITDETANYVKENHKYNNIIDYAKAHIKSRFEYEAEFLTELGYAKSTDVAEEIFAEIKERGISLFLLGKLLFRILRALVYYKRLGDNRKGETYRTIQKCLGTRKKMLSRVL